MGNGHLENGMQMVAQPFVVDALARKNRELIELKCAAGWLFLGARPSSWAFGLMGTLFE